MNYTQELTLAAVTPRTWGFRTSRFVGISPTHQAAWPLRPGGSRSRNFSIYLIESARSHVTTITSSSAPRDASTGEVESELNDP